MRFLAAALLLFFVSCTPSAADRWWAHVRWLADDARQGRETGSPGYLAAAQYVAHEFERVGAKPAGTAGFFQPVRFISRRIREPECLLALVRTDRVDTLELGEDAIFSTSFDPADSIEAGAVFVGHGLELPEAGLRDLEGIDLKGKIAVFLRGAPPGIPSTVSAHAQSIRERWRRMREAGAVGMAAIPDPQRRQIPWERSKANRFETGFTLADSSLMERAGQRFGVTVNSDRAEPWFQGSEHTFAEILDAAHGQKTLPRFTLPYRIRARVRVDERTVESPNVVGVIPGSDPMYRGEAVVLSAHLDHLGIGSPIAGDSIYNGAMDNASGVATLIEIAHALHHSRNRPKRSIVLLAVTGEEKGLLGSRAFAERPPPAVGRLVANLNLDMFLPIAPLRSVIVYGIEESELGDWFRAIAESSGVKIRPDPEPEQTHFVRSDQYNMVRVGIPSLFVTFGATGDSTLDRRFVEWNKNRYHAPSDDLEQPVDRDAAVAFNRLLERACREAADRAERPRWKADSFFRRFARDPAAIAPSEQKANRADARRGIPPGAHSAEEGNPPSRRFRRPGWGDRIKSEAST